MADPTVVSATIIDDAGVTATAIDYVDFDGALTTVNDLLDFAVYWGQKIDAMSDGRVQAVTISIKQSDITGVKANPVADSTVERGGLFSYSQVGSAYIYSVEVPAIADSLVTGGKIDLTASAVNTWRNYMQDQAHAFPAQSKAGNAINLLKSAVLTFRKHRKQRVRASFEEA